MIEGIIIRETRSVYWPVFKCASTTVKRHIARIQGRHDLDPHSVRFETTHRPLNGYFNFAFVRHPFQRLVSVYFNFVSENHELPRHKIFGVMSNSTYVGMPFKQFVDIALKEKNSHWSPQCELIPDGVEIFKLEESSILRALFLPENKSRAVYYQEIMDDQSLKIAAQYYKADLLRFDYGY